MVEPFTYQWRIFSKRICSQALHFGCLLHCCGLFPYSSPRQSQDPPSRIINIYTHVSVISLYLFLYVVEKNNALGSYYSRFIKSEFCSFFLKMKNNNFYPINLYKKGVLALLFQYIVLLSFQFCTIFYA